MEHLRPRDGAVLRRWSPYPPTVPGIYLYCAHQGALVSRLLVEWCYCNLVARPLDGEEPVPVRRIMGWWYLEDAVTSEKQVMETEETGSDTMKLEWLT